VNRCRLVEIINRGISEKQMTRTAFAARAGISRSELYKLLGQDIAQVRLGTICRLARALGRTPKELVQEVLD